MGLEEKWDEEGKEEDDRERYNRWRRTRTK